MISQTTQDAGRNAEVRNFADAANAAASAEQQTESRAGDALLRPGRAATKPVPKNKRIADAQALEAHAERRRRLARQVREENPSRTEEEIEERLAQFGA
jgi:hypothetical protein